MDRQELIYKFMNSPTNTNVWLIDAEEDLTDFLSKEHDCTTEGLAFMLAVIKHMPIERLESMVK